MACCCSHGTKAWVIVLLFILLQAACEHEDHIHNLRTRVSVLEADSKR